MGICYESTKTWLTLDSLGTSKVKIVVICYITIQVRVIPLYGFYIKNDQTPEISTSTFDSKLICLLAVVMKSCRPLPDTWLPASFDQ